MRVAIVSDIHGNRTAFGAVLEDLRQTAPDLIFHGGDLADGGAGPAEIVDQVRDLGWPGVAGNADEMLWAPDALTNFANQSPQLKQLFAAVGEIASATRAALGEERLAWLRNLPRTQVYDGVALVHASPASLWRAPAPDASDDDLASTYGPLGRPIVVYAHIHRPYVRTVSGMIVANTGSVSLSYDGDQRAAYLLLDESGPVIRRVEYDVEKEVQALAASGIPHADWIARMLASASPQMP
jgi:putative phosphoesterase